MQLQCLNLYEYFGVTPEKNARAELTVLHYPTSCEVSRYRKKPAVLVIPGGGYGMTSDREAEPIAFRFLTYGFVPFILRYSCTPLHFPTQLREAAMAMRFIRENAQKYEVDANMVAAIGFSAGGHLCGSLGTMYDCHQVADIAPAAVIRPDALAMCYPVTLSWGNTHGGTMDNVSGGDEKLRQELSLDRRVRPDMPPVFLWHTRNDTVVPVRNSIVFAQALDEHGVDFSLHVYRNGWHGLSTCDTQVYPSHVKPDASWDVPGWLESCVRFWQEMGLQITDSP